MAARKTTDPTLKHNPFAALAEDPALARRMASQTPPAALARDKPARPPPPAKLRLRLESRGRSGKVVTRISGLPAENLTAIAARMQKAMGCGALIEDKDLLLLGTLLERASEWLERAGDLRSIQEERVRPEPRNVKPEAPPEAPGMASSHRSGTRRSDVQRGQRVAIVMKADQPTGKLTTGVVRELLTNAAVHPRGIKVRLETGEVGRVKLVYS